MRSNESMRWRLHVAMRLVSTAAALPGLADKSVQHLAELTPAAWAARNR